MPWRMTAGTLSPCPATSGPHLIPAADMGQMVRRVLFAAFIAGALAGLAVSALHQFTTTPLILQAETFEKSTGTPDKDGGHADGARVHADVHADVQGGPPGAVERIVFALAANILLGIGFCLLLTACFAIHGAPVTGTVGLMWGMAGFAVFALAPGLGLPPELPGTVAADLPARQGWWALTAVSTAVGLWLLVFRDSVAAKLGGVAVILIPHLIGAPHPIGMSHAVPAELAARFAAASIVVSAVFWAMSGWLSGTVYRRFSEREEDRAVAAHTA